jgi:hypothetical protein
LCSIKFHLKYFVGAGLFKLRISDCGLEKKEGSASSIRIPQSEIRNRKDFP